MFVHFKPGLIKGNLGMLSIETFEENATEVQNDK